MTKCHEPHPDKPDLMCDKTSHPFGAHMNRATGTTWEGICPPKPVTTKKGSTLAGLKDEIASAGTSRRTGQVSVQQLRDEILGKTWEKTEEESKEMLEGAIRRLAASGNLFTADDLRALMPEGWRPATTNSIGAAFSRAAKQGIIAKTGYVPAQSEKSHGRIIHQWVGVQV